MSGIDTRWGLLALAVGLLLPLGLSELPGSWAPPALVVLALLALLSRRGLLLAVMLCGIAWSLTGHQYKLQQRLDMQLDGQRVWLEARVAGLPEETPTGWRFVLDQARLADGGMVLPRMRASWFAGEPVAQGEHWRFQATLRRPRGMSNPGGFDYESWLYAQDVGALASIRAGERLHEVDAGQLDSLRGQVRDRLQQALLSEQQALRVLALIVGDRSGISTEDWELTQATGTTHLLVISGMHVGILAGAMFFLVTLVGRLLPLPWPRFWLGAPLAIIAAAAYAGLAGFAVPTQRALLMVCLTLATRLLYRQPSPWSYWLAAFCAVVMLEPAAPLQAGFWLSFMAVALLFVGLGGRLALRGLWWRWGQSQWVIFLGLWPWLLLWGLPGSLIAPLTNVLAIPWVTLVVVPLALAGAVLELLMGIPWLLQFSAQTLDWMFAGLSWVAGWRGAEHMAFPGWLNWLLGTVGLTVLVSPLVRLVWLPAMVCALVLFMVPKPRPLEGELWVTVLDVGQGLSVLLQTRHHALLYDAGALLPSGFDLGQAVVYPALLASGVKRLDTLLISHPDNDHAGGALSVRRNMPVTRVLAGQYESVDPKLAAEPCKPGEHWYWDGVRFEIVYSAPAPASSNERSCVLRAVTGDSAIILPGDLGIRGEYQMLRHELRADILLAPHHGSRSSSSYAFIRAVEPRWVVFSAGYHNQYRHPHPLVVERYRELQVEPVYTGRSGALRFVLNGEQSRWMWSWREQARRFWHEK